MKVLVVCYSRTGNTKKLGQKIVEQLKCDFEEVIDNKKRDGVLGYILGGKDAAQKNLTTIGPISKSPKGYDIVIIGTPVWAFTMAPAIRTYLTTYREVLPKVAIFCTMGGSGDKSTFEEMEKLVNKTSISRLTVKTVDMIKDNYSSELDKFISQIQQS